MHSIAKVRITTHQAGMVLVIFARPVSIKTLLPTHWQYTLKDTQTLRFSKTVTSDTTLQNTLFTSRRLLAT